MSGIPAPTTPAPEYSAAPPTVNANANPDQISHAPIQGSNPPYGPGSIGEVPQYDEKQYPNQPPQEPQQPVHEKHLQQPPQVNHYPPQPQATVLAAVIPLESVQSAPCPVNCPKCHQQRITRIEPRNGGTVHGWAAVACCCLCLPCIPYLMRSLKDIEHYCGNPDCNVKLAVWHNSGRVERLQY